MGLFNKADKANLEGMIEPPGAVLISARTGEGLEALLNEIARRVAALRHPVELLVPYEKGAALSLIHEKGQVLSEEYGAEGTTVTCLLDTALHRRVLKLLEG